MLICNKHIFNTGIHMLKFRIIKQIKLSAFNFHLRFCFKFFIATVFLLTVILAHSTGNQYSTSVHFLRRSLNSLESIKSIIWHFDSQCIHNFTSVYSIITCSKTLKRISSTHNHSHLPYSPNLWSSWPLSSTRALFSCRWNKSMSLSCGH
jgi:hypothetical protein